ncbi:MAG: SUMF1/EgtB/PvdO family nonheme iron enzyme [candidate division KSB1 bacterium]|nr:SUMF1/EgtB/PvdO family nonheme iron enzyme [candidate division KSB1 bacterium]
MIDIATIAASVIGEVGLKELLRFLNGNKKALQKAYEKAFQNTVDWYEKEYPNKSGSKDNRFFHYRATENELAKLLFLKPEPDLSLISRIELRRGESVQPREVLAFVNHLREELSQIRECEAVLVEREKFLILTGIKSDTADIRDGIKELVNLKKREMGLEEKLSAQKIVPDPTPIDWHELEKMFRDVYRLDRLDYGHLGTTRDRLEHKLELQKVYVALNVKDRTFDRIVQAAKVKKLSIQQQKNLPLLFQRFDELLHLEHEKDQRIAILEEETDEETSHTIAKKILEECRSSNLRQAEVIIKEIMSGLRLEREQVYPILWQLSSWAIVPRPLESIPAKAQFHLFIGDAGAGKSTACRYLALQCFEALRGREQTRSPEETWVVKEKPLPIYLRLEDFGKLIAEYGDASCCLFECAARFWQRSDKTQLFSAGQLLYALQHQPVWLFLDGLDEISNAENRLKLAEAARDIVSSNQFPQLQITLTSRPAAITDELLNTLGIPYFIILNLEQNQIEDFAYRYFAANLLDETEERVRQQAQELIDALEEVPAARRLATNPLLLTVIAVLHYKEGKLPHYRAELYEKCIEQLMAQKAATPGKLETGKISFQYPRGASKPIIDWNHNQIIDMLRDLAFHAHQRTEDEVFLNPDLMLQRLRQSDLIPPEKKSSSELEEAAKFFLDECDRLIGLLAFRGGHYMFIHRTFQEYLAAHWLSLQKEAVQRQHLFAMLENAPHWREVIRLFFNRLGKSNPTFGEELLEQLGNRAIEQKDVLLLKLAAECLSDFEEYQRRYRLHDSIKVKLVNLRDRSHRKPQLFLACGDALGMMNEPFIDPLDPPMVLLKPEKPFLMGSNENDNEKPIHPVQLSPYWIGKYPVTNKEFAEFIKGGGYKDEKYWFVEDSACGDDESNFKFDGREFLKELKEKLPRYWLDEKFGRSRPLAPVVGVSWYEAMAYCMWLSEKNPGKKFRLPTEAEWEFAARRFTNREYPWGNEWPNPKLANFDESKLEQTTVVGSYPPASGAVMGDQAEEQIFDLAGNVWEWCYDYYNEDYYQYSPERDPKGPETGYRRVVRGGSWNSNEDYLACSFRNGLLPVYRYGNVGFRVACGA